MGLNDRQIEAVLYVKENGNISNRIYRDMFDITEKTAFRDFEKLIKLNLLRKKGAKKGTIYLLNV